MVLTRSQAAAAKNKAQQSPQPSPPKATKQRKRRGAADADADAPAASAPLPLAEKPLNAAAAAMGARLGKIKGAGAAPASHPLSSLPSSPAGEASLPPGGFTIPAVQQQQQPQAAAQAEEQRGELQQPAASGDAATSVERRGSPHAADAVEQRGAEPAGPAAEAAPQQHAAPPAISAVPRGEKLLKPLPDKPIPCDKLPDGPEPVQVEVEYPARSELQPVEDPAATLAAALSGMGSSDWVETVRALGLLRQLAAHQPCTCAQQLDTLLPLVLKSVRSLRSSVCKTAIMAVCDLYEEYGEALLPLTDVGGQAKPLTSLLAQLLLKCASNDKKFVLEEAQRALHTMVASLAPGDLLPLLLPYAEVHKNPKVRGKAGGALAQAVSRMAPAELAAFGLPRLLQAAGKLVTDNTPDARGAAKGMIEQLRAAAADPAVEASLPAEAPAPAAVAAAAGGDAAEDAAPAAPPTRWEALCQAHLTAFAALAVLKAASSESAELEALAQPHVDSYDYFLGEGMQHVIESMDGIEIDHPHAKTRHRFWFKNPAVSRPIRDDAGSMAAGGDQRLFPRECREAGTTYKAAFQCDLVYQVEGLPEQRIPKRLGSLPIMLKSRACYLRNLSRRELVARKEESNEFGGTFVCNGIERIIRMLVQNRRHYIMALRRGAYHKRGPAFTEMATLIRCVRPDESSLTNRCHYLIDGSAVFAITIRRAEYFIPAGILLKCFLEVTDRELYDKLVQAVKANEAHCGFVAERVELLLRQASNLGLHTRAACVEYLGNLFRSALDAPPRKTDFQVGEQLLRELLFIHLEAPADKLALAVQMLLKLFALADRQCGEDNPDAPTHHEVLLPGHLLLKFLREQLETALDAFRQQVLRDLETRPEVVNLQDEQYIRKTAERMQDVGQKFEYLLNTGNLVSRSGLDLSQSTGFTVVAEKLNFFRYLSHFRSIHRGAYFAELRTTTVRKLLPESWGFLCPVHTPDGSPCGLLNHFTASCRIVTHENDQPDDIVAALCRVLAGLGMVPSSPALPAPPLPAHLCVQVDGRVVGHVRASLAGAMLAHLRAVKAANLAAEEQLTPGAKLLPVSSDEAMLPWHTEVVHIPFEKGAPYPGIFIFTQAARMIRPVKQIASGAAEMIGSLEQNNMNIRVPDGGEGGSKRLKFTHAEFHTSSMLSVVASLTPYSDFNQSPRNMYQCQMAKQTMGTPAQALAHRSDNKMYRIQTPQTPIARTKRYEHYCMDEFPNGTNAIVAVLAYTGYDMEDAMILNKSSVERGFAHAYLYKNEQIDLREERGRDLAFQKDPAKYRPKPYGEREKPKGAFGDLYPQAVPSTPASRAVKEKGIQPEGAHKGADIIDEDGLPHIGAPIWPGQSYYSAVDKLTGRSKGSKLKGEETAVIDQVSIVGGGKDKSLKQANIKLRFNRNPVIGDKFASRHGQKGVLSRLFEDVDMPFCEQTGMRPDLLINPHAFPSRMTIGMLIESLTGKAGALTGQFVDASPFQSSDAGEKVDQPEEFGQLLEQAGFTRNGGEVMISGVTGEPFPVDIYIGVVYYQRLRHMVSDKFQVRSTGPINPLTRQPIKGRKFGGGIRFGEMERDSLLAHGAAYLLHDRLHSCSDYTVMDVCANCGLLVSTVNVPQAASDVTGVRATSGEKGGRGTPTCRLCESSKYVERVALPYVFKYLVSELAAMNIRCSLDVQ
ncbi:DNA-directed RNA polymerase I subunit 2 isoform X1 [Micractinium conductrix]|uniref:DNA-directed RNA polymerase subunit beta n=1 Tax=Micractinium conductrix TaxID=554055 RepID=A0A2P6VRU5_9CHLO|nr:DNA-directed RNA polymerase I subunit 2 isoform X1 [Micractinium conductrix]|eukprot:PSC76790.1 DNA-directed RNA polymerase I subunit 2 isoform X1 [Micractinium conductrix]